MALGKSEGVPFAKTHISQNVLVVISFSWLFLKYADLMVYDSPGGQNNLWIQTACWAVLCVECTALFCIASVSSAVQHVVGVTYLHT